MAGVALLVKLLIPGDARSPAEHSMPGLAEIYIWIRGPGAIASVRGFGALNYKYLSISG